MRTLFMIAILFPILSAHGIRAGEEPGRLYGGINPRMSYANNEGECGTGALVPWADRLWVITYAPHAPRGSSDKLYEIDNQRRMTVRAESVGGTHANRMIHRETDQLLIGPYVIDRNRNVRVIPRDVMPGRLTGVARHLTKPDTHVYYATMEEGFYEVDLKTLAVKMLYQDANQPNTDHSGPLLPGYHGKGFYSGWNRVIYANNGERSALALTKPDIASGCLASWDGRDWTVVRRSQFTEVTGPGGIFGNAHPLSDPVWSVGWDHRSLILMTLDQNGWSTFRLPKASHSYDGAHGWNTEWPRIRDIGETDLLMTMHGMFWRFPRGFRSDQSAGLTPRSRYLKVVGDFCRWGDSVVLGCDDTAKSEFLNKRASKGNLAGPGVSQSNLWFLKPDDLDRLGPARGRGAVLRNDDVKKGHISDPYLFAGFAQRAMACSHQSDTPVRLRLEIDPRGTGQWQPLRNIDLAPRSALLVPFAPSDPGVWIRVRCDDDATKLTVMFTGSNPDPRKPTDAPDPAFRGLAAKDTTTYGGGLLHAMGDAARSLQCSAVVIRDGKTVSQGYYQMGADMILQPAKDSKNAGAEWMKTHVAIPSNVLQADAASVIFVAENGQRFRLPRGNRTEESATPYPAEHRIDREVCTERDLFHAAGIFYELPAENAGGFAKIQPITTHNRSIMDYCSWRGLLVLTGLDMDQRPTGNNAHIVRSADGKAAVWAGAVDDLWRLGKPVGRGGPWKESDVNAGTPSDPYLMSGFDRKSLELSHNNPQNVRVRVELDVTGNGDWHKYQDFYVPPGSSVKHIFPDHVDAYWVRCTADRNCRATAVFFYE